MRDQQQMLAYQMRVQREKIKENKEKIKVNKTLPYLVATIVEILDNDSLEGDEETDEATGETTATKGSKSAVIRTTTRQTIFLPVIGLVDADDLEPGDTVGVNKDSFLVRTSCGCSGFAVVPADTTNVFSSNRCFRSCPMNTTGESRQWNSTKSLRRSSAISVVATSRSRSSWRQSSYPCERHTSSSPSACRHQRVYLCGDLPERERRCSHVHVQTSR